jgi:hypothetical protein
MSLLTNLISYWPMDEASGNALDAHGSNPLTDNGTVGSAAGKVGGARSLAAASEEFFSHADNADLSTGNVDFAFAGWFNLASAASESTILGKAVTSNAQGIDYQLFVSGGTLTWRVTPDGDYANRTQVSAGSIATGTWYHFVAWHDSVADVIGLAVNAGTPATAAHTTGVFDGTGLFTIGDLSGFVSRLDGLIDEVGLWKGRILTAQERTDLYNGGAGLAYSSFGGGGTPIPVFMHHYKQQGIS